MYITGNGNTDDMSTSKHQCFNYPILYHPCAFLLLLDDSPSYSLYIAANSKSQISTEKTQSPKLENERVVCVLIFYHFIGTQEFCVA